MKVYVVTWGCYSDRRVVAVRSSKRDAARLAACDRAGDGNVEAWEMDAGPMPAPGLVPWHVEIDRDGSSEATGRHETNYARDDYDTPRIATDSWFECGMLQVNTWARDQEHAVKIANDIRAQKIASGEWTP